MDMTTNHTTVVRSKVALAALTLDVYATAKMLHTDAHRCWMRSRRFRGEDHPVTQAQFAYAAELALYLNDAKSKHQAAKAAALAVTA